MSTFDWVIVASYLRDWPWASVIALFSSRLSRHRRLFPLRTLAPVVAGRHVDGPPHHLPRIHRSWLRGGCAHAACGETGSGGGSPSAPCSRCFFSFPKLWRRAGVVTEVELTEMRYSGRPAAALRGFKAIYIGVLFNCYAMGAWVMTGIVKVMGVTTGWDKLTALGVVVGIALIYSVLAGLWGVVATDFIQFFVALAGAVILAVYAVDAVGGLGQLKTSLAGTGKLDMLPPRGDGDFFGPRPWPGFAGMFLIQWWAWKNTDGGGIIIQRMAASRDEKQAVYATLWYNIAHYAIRSWPWILVGLASLLLLNEADFGGVIDDERAYPIMIMKAVCPTGFGGF